MASSLYDGADPVIHALELVLGKAFLAVRDGQGQASTGHPGVNNLSASPAGEGGGLARGDDLRTGGLREEAGIPGSLESYGTRRRCRDLRVEIPVFLEKVLLDPTPTSRAVV